MYDTKNRSTVRVGHHLLVGAFAAAATLGTTTAVADIFLKIGDIKGDSIDRKHTDEIVVLAWSWGVAGPVVGDKKKNNAPACAFDLSITKKLDVATPPLVLAAVLNTTIPTALLTVQKAGDNPFEAVKISLTGVTVQVTNEGSSGPDSGTETVNLGFTSATITYTPQKPDGTAGVAVTATTPGSCQ